MFVNFLTNDCKGKVSFAKGNNLSKREQRKLEFEKQYGKNPVDYTNDTLEIFYINDLHRKFGPIFSLHHAVDRFEKGKFKQNDVDKLKIAAGDLVVGSDEKLNSFFFKLFSKKDEKNNPFGLGFDALCLGNHEFDAGEAGLARELDQELSYQFVATNLNIKDSSPLVRHKDSKIVKSFIKEINGTKYGFVGVLPNNLNGNGCTKTRFDGIEVTGQDNPNYWEFDQTISAVRDEVKKLSSQTDKIICISHIGETNNELLAKKVEGIDVIIGGHKHDKYFKIISQDNKPDKAATVMVQAGRNGEQYGILKVQFDKEGKIIPDNIYNRRYDIELWPDTNCARTFYEKIDGQLGETTEYIGTLLEDYFPTRNKIKENPVLTLLTDAIRYKAMTLASAKDKQPQLDIAFLMNQYDYTNFKLNKGPFSKRQIQDLVTYQDRIYRAWLSGKEIIEILDWGSLSLDDNNNNKKGLVQVSGIKYKISPKGVEEISLLDMENNETPFDINQKYYVGYDAYFIKRAKSDGKDNIVKILQKNAVKKCDFNVEEALLDFLRSKKEPFAIEAKDRITVERNQSNNSGTGQPGAKDNGYVHRQPSNGSFKGSLVGIK